MAFVPPDRDERIRAIGPTEKLPRLLQRAYDPADDLRPIPPPGPHDWLAHHVESGQTFEAFLDARPRKPDAIRNKIYLQPLDSFSETESPSLPRLQGFAEAFFGIAVDVLPTLTLTEVKVESRKNPYTGQVQVRTTDLLSLLAQRRPDDAYCVLGITMRDLYPDPSWNFVFGQASASHRVGVYSFARYAPGFNGERVADAEKLVLRRSCKVLAHETAHMFGIAHCVYFHCLMNGSNHLAESDARPLRLCPVDLRKLEASVGFDVVDRYRRLRRVMEQMGFADDARWLERRLAYLGGP